LPRDDGPGMYASRSNQYFPGASGGGVRHACEATGFT
jgi:hypothetical protein